MANEVYTGADYAFVTAVVRAREAKMLSDERTNRIIDAPSYNDAAAMLEECGYPNMKDLDAGEMFEVLREHRNTVYRELGAIETAKAPLDFFRVKFDYHNVKAAVKSEALGLPIDKLMYQCGRVSREKFVEAWEQQDFSGFPKLMGQALVESKAILARTGDPQLSDIEADKAQFTERLAIGVEMNDPFVIDYMHMYIDLVNLRTIVRAERMCRNVEFIKQSLIPGGNVGVERLCALGQSGDELKQIFENTPAEKAAALGAAALTSDSVSEFEIECDDARTRYMAQSGTVPAGPAPVVAYLFALENELATIRVVLGGIRARLPRKLIRERMRKTYV